MGKSRNNHYIPQMYLRQWEKEGGIYVYNLLVSHENVPLWTKKPIKHVGSLLNLYMRVEEDIEYDDIEQFFNENYESPAKTALEKACNSGDMTPNDWELLISFVCAQFVRTVPFYIRIHELMKKGLPQIMDDTCLALPDYLAKKSTTSPENNNHTGYTNKYQSLLPISLKAHARENEGDVNLEITTVGGKNLWLMSIKQLLDKDSLFYKTVHGFKWSIASAPPKLIWPTSDNPIFLVQEIEKERYILTDGIIGKERFMAFPISPTKILLASERRRFPFRFEMDLAFAREIQRMIMNNAFRYVFCNCKDENVVQQRKRTEDEGLFKRLQKEFDGWYDSYKETEGPYLKDKKIHWEN